MDDAQLISIDGEFTIFTAAEIRDRLLDAMNAPGRLNVDLSGVTEMDTAGLQIMLASQLEATRRRMEVAFVSASQAVRDVLAIYGLADRLSAESRQAAVEPAAI